MAVALGRVTTESGLRVFISRRRIVSRRRWRFVIAQLVAIVQFEGAVITSGRRIGSVGVGGAGIHIGLGIDSVSVGALDLLDFPGPISGYFSFGLGTGHSPNWPGVSHLSTTGKLSQRVQFHSPDRARDISEERERDKR